MRCKFWKRKKIYVVNNTFEQNENKIKKRMIFSFFFFERKKVDSTQINNSLSCCARSHMHNLNKNTSFI